MGQESSSIPQQCGFHKQNNYLMAATYEVVQQKGLNFFRMSFMAAGQTKLAPDQMFSVLAHAYYASDVFNENNYV